MPFNSLAYALLLSAATLLTAAWSRPAAVLIAASALFYAVAGPLDAAVFAATVTANWLIQVAALSMRARIAAAAAVNIGLIAFFKYRGLLMGEAGLSGSYLDTALPLGISFYCFQALAYHVDVARGQTPPARSFASFVLFKSFFPQLVAGPIVRAHQFLPQIERLMDNRPRRHRLVSYGLALCVLGLVKKVVLADSLAPHVDEIFAGQPETAYLAWLGATLFAFQIYFDFSGYSDIAIGSAYLLGIRLPFNFSTPYVSRSPREFWQRWHISLSTWIRDYVYIPLGGGRGGRVRAGLVLVGTMAVAGLWHGANYTFILWGAGWGLYILAGRLAPAGWRLPSAIGWPLHMAVILALWVLFRAPSLDYAASYLGTMLSFQGWQPPAEAAPAWMAALGVAGLFALHWLEAGLHRRPTLGTLRRFNSPFVWGLLSMLGVLLAMIPSMAANPFIYFRF